MTEVSQLKSSNNLKSTVIQTLASLGGLNKFIKSGDVVMVKPNFNTADPYPASTDFDFLKTVVELVYEAGAKLVMICESSTMTLNTKKVLQQCRVFELQDLTIGARVYVLEEGKWTKKEIPEAKYLKTVALPDILQRSDKLILLPCLKTHFLAQYSGALKLAVAFMKPRQRVSLHLKNIQEKIAELNLLLHPDLIIMDARKCFINKGPSDGQIAEPNLILASTSRVAIDIEGVKIIQRYKGNSLKGIEPAQLPQIKRAIEIGIS